MLDYRTSAAALVMSVLLHTAAGAQQSTPQNPSPAIRPMVCPPVQAQRAGAIILRAGECPNRTFIGY